MAGELSLKTPLTGLVTLVPTNTATDKTITLPATTGTMVVQDGTNTTTITNLAYTGTLTGGTGVVNIGSGQVYKDASGNVGIGTSSPVSFATYTALTVNGTNSDLELTRGGSRHFALITSSGATDITNVANVPLTFGTNATENMRIVSGGNVGIGTTSPQAKLAVSNGGAAGLEFFVNYPGGGVGTYIQSYNRSSPGYVNTAYDAADHSFRISGTEKMFLNSSGNLGIGTASPLAKLQVYPTVGAPASSGSLNTGVIFAEGAGGPSLNMGNFNSGGTYYAWIQSAFVNNAAVVQPLVLQQIGGELLVGTTSAYVSSKFRVKSSGTTSATYNTEFENSAGTVLFAVRDDGYFFTGVAANSPYNITTGSAANCFINSDGALYRSTSSLRYKTDVQDATYGLADLLALRPVTYKSKSESDGDKVFGGLIAEEVHEAGLTEFVQYAEDGSPDALNYGNMVSLCIKAIQELTARLEVLENK